MLTNSRCKEHFIIYFSSTGAATKCSRQQKYAKYVINIRKTLSKVTSLIYALSLFAIRNSEFFEL